LLKTNGLFKNPGTIVPGFVRRPEKQLRISPTSHEKSPALRDQTALSHYYTAPQSEGRLKRQFDFGASDYRISV
jgi:hypothetical protein